MKVKGNKVNYKSIFIIITVLLMLAFISFLNDRTGNQEKTAVAENEREFDIDSPTIIDQTQRSYDVIINELGIIHKDSVCTIHLIKESATPTLFYVYKDPLTTQQLTDRFALQVVPKDLNILKNTSNPKYVRLDFGGKPNQILIEGNLYFVFTKSLTHELIDLDNISHINTGRYRGNSRPYFIRNIKLTDIYEHLDSKNLETIKVVISRKGMNKLESKRIKAIQSSILITEDDDLVDAKIVFKGSKKLKAQIRLKGDWVDHLTHPTKWSFRVVMDDGNTINGLRKYSLQHPKTRNYLWEWLFNKAIKQNDIIGLKYEFVNVNLIIDHKDSLETKPLGIMAFEEAFDKILIENNNRREGILLAFDESLIWSDRQKQIEFNLDPSKRNKRVQSFTTSPIKLYNSNKVLSDPKLSKQFNIAKDMIDGLKSGKLKLSEVFDIDKLTMFVALTNLFGGGHGLTGHNLKIYFNPITNKFEPIAWDSNSGDKIQQIIDYRFSSNDTLYSQKLVEKFELVSSSEFVNKLVMEHQVELNNLASTLSTEFTETFFDYSILEYNSNVIKKEIYPSSVIIASLQNLNTNQIEVDIENTSIFPVAIDGLIHKDGKFLSQKESSIILPFEKKKISFQLKESFVNAFVSKKNKKGEFRYPKDLNKVHVQFHMLGQEHLRREQIIPFSISENLDDNLANYRSSFQSNLEAFDFINVDLKKNAVVFKKGSYKLKENLIIPSGFSIQVLKGFELDITNNASIISYSSFNCNGTSEFPIRFYSSDSSGGGIFISGAAETSIFNHCEFSNLSNPNSDIWELSGSVNLNETTVTIKNSLFEKNRCEDGLNIIRSKFTLESSIFKDTKSDAFDGDFVEGTISNCTFINSGNDGVDVSGSKIVLDNIIFKNPADKAISAGENSTIEGSKIDINGGEIGIVSKDFSTVLLSNVTIKDTRLGFSSFQKKSEFGPGKIAITDLKMTNIESDYLIETGSSLTIDNIVATTVSNKVIDQMYGKEYGKSSK